MNTIETLTAAAEKNNRELTLGALSEMIKSLSPEAYNSIIIDNAVAIKRYNYCYINAFTQSVSHKSDKRTAAIDGTLKETLQDLATAAETQSQPYIPLQDRTLILLMEQAPKVSEGGFFSAARKKMSELVNGGRTVEHRHITLAESDGHIAKEQSPYAVAAECSVSVCPECKSQGTIEQKDKDGVVSVVECPTCKGRGHIGTLSYFTPVVNEKRVTIVRCLEGSIENLKTSTLEAHKGDDTTPVRMLTHYNGTDKETFDPYITPYLDTLRDKTGALNALEEIYYRIIPCFTFNYRNVLTGEIRMGVLVDPFVNPELVLSLDSTSRKIFSGMKNSLKNVNNFLGSIGKSTAYKDKEDLKRTIRLLIAIAVADGDVSDEEKKALTLTIRNMDNLTTSEQEQMLQLLGQKDSSFLTDSDFVFHFKPNAEETLTRMQDIAAASDGITDEERTLIERLRLSI